MPTYVETWDETIPAGSRNISLGDDDIRELKRALRERLATDHHFLDDETGSTTVGYHDKVTFIEQASDPTAVTDTGMLYTKDVSDVSELFYQDQAGNIYQITSNGKLNSQTIDGVIPAANLPVYGTAHSIARGFETVYSSVTAVSVQAGTLYHGSTKIEKTANTTLNLGTPADWYDGAIDSYAAAAGFCYIGVNSSGDIKFLGANAADKADDSGNTAGTKLYWYDTVGLKYWRVLPVTLRINTSDQISQKFYQRGKDRVYFDGLVTVVNGGSDAAYDDKDCSDYIPATATTGMFLLECDSDARTSYIRPNGATGDMFKNGRAGFMYCECPTDSSQVVEWYIAAGGSASLYLSGYISDVG